MEKKEEKEKLTKYERARLLGARAMQIAHGAPFKIPLTPEQLKAIKYSPIEIAKMELEAGVLPLTIERPKPRRIEELEEGTVPKA